MIDTKLLEKYKLIYNLPGEKERGKKATELLEAKYGKEFRYKNARPVGLKDDFYTVISYSVENPYLLFEARISLDETTVCDEYAIKAACDDYCKQMLGRVKKLNGYLLLRMQSLIRGFQMDEIQIDISKLQEIKPRNCYSIDVYYGQSDKKSDDLYEVINEMLSGDERIEGVLNLYILPEEVFDNAQKYLESHDKAYMDFYDVLEGRQPLSSEIIKGKLSVPRKEWEERMVTENDI